MRLALGKPTGLIKVDITVLDVTQGYNRKHQLGADVVLWVDQTAYMLLFLG